MVKIKQTQIKRFQYTADRLLFIYFQFKVTFVHIVWQMPKKIKGVQVHETFIVDPENQFLLHLYVVGRLKLCLLMPTIFNKKSCTKLFKNLENPIFSLISFSTASAHLLQLLFIADPVNGKSCFPCDLTAAYLFCRD